MTVGHEVLFMDCRSCRVGMTLAMGDADWWPSAIEDAATGELVDADAPLPADPVRKPLCVSCIERIEAERRRLGLPVAWVRYQATRRG